MRIDIISVVPEMLDGFLNTSILARAQKKGLVEIHVHNLRDYTTDKHRRVDDYPYGGFAGMVMQCQPIDDCIAALKAERDYDEVIFTSPDGEKFDQPMANSLSMKGNLIILCGHYKGIDYRIREHLITKEVSIGDFVLTGGELAAACMTGAIVRITQRLLPRPLAGSSRLHAPGRLQRLESARCAPLGPRREDPRMGDGTIARAHETTPPRSARKIKAPPAFALCLCSAHRAIEQTVPPICVSTPIEKATRTTQIMWCASL